MSRHFIPKRPVSIGKKYILSTYIVTRDMEKKLKMNYHYSFTKL